MTEEDISTLRWARLVNDETEIGLFGPTVKRTGAIAECEELVRAGLLRRKDPPDSRAEYGYWITPAGRAALASVGQ